jgi:class 3 adenylate cyclase
MTSEQGAGAAATLPLTPAVVWLLHHGAAAAGPGALLGGLAGRLAEDGLPLDRASLTVSSLDPLTAARDFHWRRADGRIIEVPRFHGAPRPAPAAPAGIASRIPGTEHRVGWVPAAGGGFTPAEREHLAALTWALAAPLQAVVAHATLQALLQAYLGRRSAARVLAGAAQRGAGEVIEAVIWISDLRDFTRLAEEQPAAEVIGALNDSCARLVGAIQPFGGEVLKFIGDGLLAIFPLADRGPAAAAAAAVAAVRAARAGMARLDAERAAAGRPALPFGVALHLGPVMYGNIGAPDRLDFTAIGPAVNLASRIEGLCRELGCPVLASGAFAAVPAEILAPLGTKILRGIAEPVALFTLPELAMNSAP